jgi:Domain of unknown function (DUF4112)
MTPRTTDTPRPAPPEPVHVDVRRHAPSNPDPGASVDRVRVALQNAIHADIATDLQRVRKLAGWMDARFSIAGIRFGFDGLIGLVPAVGDTVTALVSLYPLSVARRHRLGGWVQAKILGNIAVDWVVGLVPLVGDLFDVGYKANTRNLKVIERAAERRGLVPPVVDGGSAGHPADPMDARR